MPSAHPLQITADFDSSHFKANVSIVEINHNQRVCMYMYPSQKAENKAKANRDSPGLYVYQLL